MSLAERLGLLALRRIDPETAHALALRGLRAGLVPLPGPVTSSRLTTTLAGMSLPNPLGLAAGFDKNAEAVEQLSRAGFGFVEVGAATPRPQQGNPRPRLYRLPAERAAINRFGFNNQGIAAIVPRLDAARPAVPVGLNLGANKDSPDRAADFAEVLRRAGPVVDFVTINVSSPNTEKLRQLQGADALRGLIEGVQEANEALPVPRPVFLKIAPDLSTEEVAGIAAVAMDTRLAGIVATNTTLSRDGLTSPARRETGGLSGPPLFARSTRVLARLSHETGGALPLIGVGGVRSAEDVLAKVGAGASAVQLYTALAWEGLSLAARIAWDLDSRLAGLGIGNVSEIVGTRRGDWLGPDF
ncbi:dihydroorotate oxidase A [Tranquillimonas rosea]|uniref:Dihydroorotate dehydrogenase (quinone) n=1 Tax=Tranquillimonas rosea TaxID=641238 RepID=A0A1H9VS80_9RHOB|nr:quinone-dependent dihydroorotate dehydrogenase [Tranquillimonas rosea]SES24418.1 dihydroorotate oxidase A [Tranquillimonas rosea]